MHCIKVKIINCPEDMDGFTLTINKCINVLYKCINALYKCLLLVLHIAVGIGFTKHKTKRTSDPEDMLTPEVRPDMDGPTVSR